MLIGPPKRRIIPKVLEHPCPKTFGVWSRLREILMPQHAILDNASSKSLSFNTMMPPLHKASWNGFGVEELDGPARSPDLNPIQRLWDELELRLWARPSCPASTCDLTNALLDEGETVPTDINVFKMGCYWMYFCPYGVSIFGNKFLGLDICWVAIRFLFLGFAYSGFFSLTAVNATLQFMSKGLIILLIFITDQKLQQTNNNIVNTCEKLY